MRDFEKMTRIVLDKIKVGKKYRIYYGKNNFDNKKIHIVAVVDGDMIIFKWFGKHKQWWHYEIENTYFFYIRMKQKDKECSLFTERMKPIEF